MAANEAQIMILLKGVDQTKPLIEAVKKLTDAKKSLYGQVKVIQDALKENRQAVKGISRSYQKLHQIVSENNKQYDKLERQIKQLQVQYDKVQKKIGQLQQAREKDNQSVIQTNQKIKELTQSNKANTKAMQDKIKTIKAEEAANRKAIQEKARAIKADAEARSKQVREMANARVAQERLRREEMASLSPLERVEKALKEKNAQLKSQQLRLQVLAKWKKQGRIDENQYNAAVRKSKDQIRQKTREIDKLIARQRQLQTTQRRTTDRARHATSSFKNMARSVIALTAAYIGLRTASRGIRMILDPAREFETYELRLAAIMGSFKLAQERLNFLAEFNKSTPFELSHLVDANIRLETLTRGALSATKGMRLLSDVAVATAQPIEDIAFHIGRIYDGLRNQRLIGESLLRLQELGVLSGATRNLLEAAQKAGRPGMEVWSLVNNELKRFQGLTKIGSERFRGAISNLLDVWWQFRVELGTPIKDFLSPEIEKLYKFIDLLRKEGVAATLGAKATGWLSSMVNALKTSSDFDGTLIEKLGAPGGFLEWFGLQLRSLAEQFGNWIMDAVTSVGLTAIRLFRSASTLLIDSLEKQSFMNPDSFLFKMLGGEKARDSFIEMLKWGTGHHGYTGKKMQRMQEEENARKAKANTYKNFESAPFDYTDEFGNVHRISPRIDKLILDHYNHLMSFQGKLDYDDLKALTYIKETGEMPQYYYTKHLQEKHYSFANNRAALSQKKIFSEQEVKDRLKHTILALSDLYEESLIGETTTSMMDVSPVAAFQKSVEDMASHGPGKFTHILKELGLGSAIDTNLENIIALANISEGSTQEKHFQHEIDLLKSKSTSPQSNLSSIFSQQRTKYLYEDPRLIFGEYSMGRQVGPPKSILSSPPTVDTKRNMILKPIERTGPLTDFLTHSETARGIYERQGLANKFANEVVKKMESQGYTKENLPEQAEVMNAYNKIVATETMGYAEYNAFRNMAANFQDPRYRKALGDEFDDTTVITGQLKDVSTIVEQAKKGLQLIADGTQGDLQSRNDFTNIIRDATDSFKWLVAEAKKKIKLDQELSDGERELIELDRRGIDSREELLNVIIKTENAEKLLAKSRGRSFADAQKMLKELTAAGFESKDALDMIGYFFQSAEQQKVEAAEKINQQIKAYQEPSELGESGGSSATWKATGRFGEERWGKHEAYARGIRSYADTDKPTGYQLKGIPEDKSELGYWSLAEGKRAVGGDEWEEDWIQFSQMIDQMEQFQQIGVAAATAVQSAFQGIATSIEGLIMGTMTWKEALANIGLSVIQGIIQAFSQMIASFIMSITIGKLLQATVAKSTLAAMAPVYAANAKGAIDMAIMTVGGAVMPGVAAYLGGVAAALGASAGMSVASSAGDIAGKKEGGYTGDMPEDKISGFHHGQEFVVKASATKRWRGLLENINAGAMPMTESPRFNTASSDAPSSPFSSGRRRFGSQSADHDNGVSVAIYNDKNSAKDWLEQRQGRRLFMRASQRSAEELGLPT